MRVLRVSGALMGLLMYCAGSVAIDPNDTRMLAQPALSDAHIAFIYANDLWVADVDGSHPRRLTVDEGVEANPVFSPDGKTIAFSAQYDGNTDVFIVPVEGGVPKRLTWHPGPDRVVDFMPDGQEILFSSYRSTHTRRYTQLFKVPVGGGFPKQLEIPNASDASFSPDGSKLAYNPGREVFRQWKNYRGGTMSVIWIVDMADYSKTEIPRPEGGCNDVNPMWIGNKIFFLSDRNGEFNLYAFDTGSARIEQLTFHEDFPVLAAAHHGSSILYEQGGYLHRIGLAGENAERLKVGIATDLQELRPRYARGARYVRSANISPSGARAVFDFRGEIVTVPAEKGDPRNLTFTPAAHEKYPAWSPDGKSVAYFSDETGEAELHIRAQNGQGPVKSYPLGGTGFYSDPNWSPDSRKISFVDNGRKLYLLDVATGAIQQIDSDEVYIPGPFRELFGDWSSDSKWFVYTKLLKSHFQQAWLYSLEQGKSFPISDGMSDVAEPCFDRDGKYIFYFASTDAGPVVNWFDQSTADMEMTRSIYMLTLQKETLSPFAPESDEEEGKEGNGDEKKDEESQEKARPKKKAEVPDDVDEGLKIDLDGLMMRIIALPIGAGDYSNLAVADKNLLLFVKREAGRSQMLSYDLKERKEEVVTDMDAFVLSTNGKKMLYANGQSWYISSAGKKPANGKGLLNLDAVQVKFDPVAEWPQIFDEVWRVNRDYFYDPNMHGADWPAMKEKYAEFLSDLACRSDLNRLIEWMCSELAVGHHRGGGGDNLVDPDRIGVGLLGADYKVENNRYRISRIFEGLNWNPGLRAPLTEPGLNVKAGEYLLAVNGEALFATQNLFEPFENTVGKNLCLTVGPNPDGTGSREIHVVPVSQEYDLRNRAWVEGNLKHVHEATDGRVAYVYVPNTAGAGHEYFKRYFFPQANKEAIIVDERYNGGGLLADYYIDILRRPYQSHWTMRYTNDIKSPTASIQGPKVMIIDENAGSGGDMLPYMFRKFGVGTMVGKTTWGGLVGVLGFPELMDGGYITAPNVAIWTEDGFIVENVGVAPDVEVEQNPADVIAGKDPQLEKAIELVLEELKVHPPKKVERPAFPKRVR